MKALVRCGAGAFAVGALLLTRRLTMTWGTRNDEHLASLEGDEFVFPADMVATRAISIAAPPGRVWPWLVQIGQGRGGFYSYDWLENLVGLDMHSADYIVDDWQELAVGDEVHLAEGVALSVATIEPGAHLVLQGAGDARMPFEFTWAFVLQPGPRGGTRLLVRERYRYLNWWGRVITEVVQPVSFLMTARMLRGIRDRAEAQGVLEAEVAG